MIEGTAVWSSTAGYSGGSASAAPRSNLDVSVRKYPASCLLFVSTCGKNVREKQEREIRDGRQRRARVGRDLGQRAARVRDNYVLRLAAGKGGSPKEARVRTPAEETEPARPKGRSSSTYACILRTHWHSAQDDVKGETTRSPSASVAYSSGRSAMSAAALPDWKDAPSATMRPTNS